MGGLAVGARLRRSSQWDRRKQQASCFPFGVRFPCKPEIILVTRGGTCSRRAPPAVISMGSPETTSFLLSLWGSIPVYTGNHFGDPWGNRTPVIGVRGRCLNRLTNGPRLVWHTIRAFAPLSRCASLLPVRTPGKYAVPILLVHHQGLEPGTP